MFKEAPCSLGKGLFTSGSLGNGRQDALQAVKLDPAVLEAQVTVHADNNTSDTTDFNKIRNVVIGNEKGKETTPTVPTPSQGPKGFKDMVLQHEAALLSLTPHQLELLMKYADLLRRQRMASQRHLECAFCKNNGKSTFWYTSHTLRDSYGRVRCPVLRGFRCPRCGATGDQAHTIKYCPDNSLIGVASSPERMVPQLKQRSNEGGINSWIPAIQGLVKENGCSEFEFVPESRPLFGDEQLPPYITSA